MFIKLSAMLVALTCYAQLQAQSLRPKPVKITAQLIQADDTTPRAMVFNFLHPFIPSRKSAAFDEQLQLSASQEMVFTQNMTIQYNGTFINLLVAPGDSVYLQIDGARLKEQNFAWLTISGDHALFSEQLNKWHYYYNNHFTKSITPAGSFPAMIDSVNAAYKQSLHLLENYTHTHPLLPEVRKWIENDIKYTVSYLAADYLVVEDSFTGTQQLNDKLYAHPIFDQYNSAGFQSMMFPYHLSNYVHTVLKADSSITRLRINMQYKDAAGKALALLSLQPSGLSRDYMLFTVINDMLPKNSLLLDSLPTLASLFSDTLTYHYLQQSAQRIHNPSFKENPIAGMVYFGKTAKEYIPPVEILRYFKTKYPGKVIYIDVYATWCIPCLQEAEKMPLIESGVDTSKIVFVNLCLQSNEVAWKELIKKRNYHGENYFLGDDATKLFMGMYEIKGFPSYMLINKQGKIVSAIAPRPSDGELLIRTLNALAD